MPRTVASNGVRPEIRALAVIKLNEPVAPSVINDQVGTGNYAAKYITFLRRMGFEFTSVKDARSIVSYTLTKEPDNAAEIRATAPKVAAPKATKVAKVAAPKVAKAPKAPVPKRVFEVSRQRPEPVANPFNTGASFAVDGDFDAAPSGDAASFLRDLGL
jgi:hypothetical protein